MDNGLKTFLPTNINYTSQTHMNSTGGYVTINVEDLLASCRAEGYTDLHLVICGSYQEKIGGWKRYETFSPQGNTALNNYLDLSISKFGQCEIGTPYNIYSFRYGEEMELDLKLQACGEIVYSIERSVDNGTSWHSVENGLINTVSAREGSELQYKYPLNKNNEKKSLYRLVASCKGEQKTVELDEAVRFLYPVS